MTIEEKDLKARSIFDNWKYLDKRLEQWDAGYASLLHEHQEWIENKGITGRSIVINGSDYFALSITNRRLYISRISFDDSRISSIHVPLQVANADNFRVI